MEFLVNSQNVNSRIICSIEICPVNIICAIVVCPVNFEPCNANVCAMNI